MSSSDERAQNKYQFLEQISTEKLKSMVLSDFLSGDSDDEANDEFITRVLEEIARREENDPSAPQFDVEAGWERFQSRFFSGEELVSQGRPTQAKADKAKSSLPRRIVFRPLRIAAITAVVILLSVMMASALGFGPFNMIAEWTQEIFQFKSEDAPQDGIEVVPESHFRQDQTPETVLEELGISASVWPTWYPEGFELSGTQVYDDIYEPFITALYENKSTERSIIVSIVIHQEPISTVHEKDETPVKTYLENDIEHFIMRNNKSIIATWFVDNLECTITGHVSEDELKTMIDSIYEGDSDLPWSVNM